MPFHSSKQPKLLTLFQLILISSFFLLLPIPSHAGNPTKYVTVHDPYTRVPSTGFQFLSTQQYYSGYNNYTNYFRVFVPPGATSIDLLVRDVAGNVIIARHNLYPDGIPDPSNNSVGWGDRYKLSDLEIQDCYVLHTGVDSLYVAHDYFGGLSTDRGGWMYVKVGGGQSNWYFQIQWSVIIRPEHVSAYNNWWDHAGSNLDGSINWEKDVESVYQYHAKKKLPSDINEDGKVDINDYNLFIQSFSKKSGDSEYNAKADLNEDKIVNILDYNIFIENFGKKV